MKPEEITDNIANYLMVIEAHKEWLEPVSIAAMTNAMHQMHMVAAFLEMRAGHLENKE